MVKFKGTGILVLIVFISGLHAQSASEKIRREIRGLEAELETQNNLEKSLVEQVEDTERKLALQKKLLRELDVERLWIEGRIDAVSDSLQKTEEGYSRLKRLVAGRMVSLYKHGKYSDWEVITGLSSLNQIMIWMKYQREILESDERNLRLLLEKKATIDKQRADYQSEMTKKEAVIREKTGEERQLTQLMNRHTTALARVNQDKRSIQEKLVKKRNAYRILRETLSEERTVKPGSYQGLRTDFYGMRGKLRWPAEGKVVTRHGKQNSALDNTYVINRSIEIETQGNKTVRTVYDGVVLYIQFLRGLGNVVVLDHGKGFYTSYGQLELVSVERGEQLHEGDILGVVGSKESLYGSCLEFGVWKDDKDYNPEEWLK